MHRLDTLLQEVQDTRSSLGIKIDDAVRDLIAKLDGIENIEASHTARMNVIEQAHVTMTTQLASLEVSVSALTVLRSSAASAVAPTTVVAMTAPTPFAINDAVRELNILMQKKANIMLTGVLSSPPLTGAGIVTKLLQEELKIGAAFVNCTRLGKPSAHVNRPNRLLVTLSSDADRSAKNLCNSSDSHVRDHVFLNADLTPK